MISGQWKLQQRARLNLLFAQNCAQATLLTLQEVFGWWDPIILKAATNLEGGVVGSGETCGVVTGGILGIGALACSETLSDPAAKEDAIYRLSGDYKRWFERRFGTSICRERVQVDFSKARGLVRYLLPGDKLIKCLSHTGEALWFLTERIREHRELQGNGSRETPEPIDGVGPPEPHCAFSVLSRIVPEQLGSFERLGWATTGLAGGVAFGGSACGALLGGILGIGLQYGYDVRSMSFQSITAAFIRGHRNLLRRSEQEPPKEAFARSLYLTEGFKRRFGSMNCRDIAHRDFSSPEDLRNFLNESSECRPVIAWSEDTARDLMKV